MESKHPTKPGQSAAITGAGRVEKSAARRAAILEAALDEFAASGFAAARLEDVARRAGVAKGTIYVHFKDKQALFEELVRTMLVPHIAALEAVSTLDGPLRGTLEVFVDHFVEDIIRTRVSAVVRLVLAEGPRFPAIAGFYYREVVQRALAALQRIVRRGIARGEIPHAQLADYPQLVVAPALAALVWGGLFDRLAPLDVSGLMRAHLDILFASGRTS